MNAESGLLQSENHANVSDAFNTAIAKAVATVAVGVGMTVTAIIGLVIWVKADWFHDPGPYPTGWAGYTAHEFVGFCLFLFFATIGYTTLYIGLTTGARLSAEGRSTAAEALWLGLLGAFACASVGLGVLGAVMWGGQSFMNCAGVFCINTNKYFEVTSPHTVRDSAGEGWLGTLGMSAFFALVPIGLILLWRIARRVLNVTFGESDQNAFPHPAATREADTRAKRSYYLTVAAFIAAFVLIFLWSWVTFYLPDDWEYFTDARIAQAGQLQIADPTMSVADRWNLCNNYYQQYTCPELPWAFFFSRQIQFSENMYLKLFPGNVFFFCYLLGILAAAFVTTHTNRKWAEFWAKPMPPMPKCTPKWLCGRFTRGEFVATWITKWFFMVSFLYWVHDHNFDGMWNPTNTGDTIGMANTERWARTMGQLAVLCLSLLMFAGSRESIMHKLLGTSWESFIWAHKALGYGMLATTFLHIALWWRQYDMWKMFPSEIFRIPPQNVEATDNFTVPAIFLTTMFLFVAMGILALEPVRRRFFEVFYYSHLIAAYTTIPITLWHASAGWEYMMPGLTVWFIDRCLRASRSAARVRVLSATTTASKDFDQGNTKVEPARAVELKFVVDSGALLAARPGQYVFINIPQISVFEWHPFTLSHTPQPDDTRENGGNYLSLHIKSMGPGTWTDRLYEQVRLTVDRYGNVPPGALTLAVDGPNGAPFEHKHYTDVLLFAGGIGVTPCAAIFDNLKRARSTSNVQLNSDYDEFIGPRKLRAFWALREEPLLFTDLKMQFHTSKTDEENDHRTADSVEAFPDQRATIFLTRLCEPEVLAAHEHLNKKNPDPLDVPCGMACGRPNVTRLLEQELCEQDMSEQNDLVMKPGRKPIVFVCGPEPLVQSVMEWCDAKGVAVHRETFLL